MQTLIDDLIIEHGPDTTLHERLLLLKIVFDQMQAENDELREKNTALEFEKFGIIAHEEFAARVHEKFRLSIPTNPTVP